MDDKGVVMGLKTMTGTSAAYRAVEMTFVGRGGISCSSVGTENCCNHDERKRKRPLSSVLGCECPYLIWISANWAKEKPGDLLDSQTGSGLCDLPTLSYGLLE